MKRKPIYAQGNPSHRIISLPNGFWVMQRYGTQKGTRDFDPWERIRHPTDFQTAIGQLKATEPRYLSGAS
jgi:hypothetical protein